MDAASVVLAIATAFAFGLGARLVRLPPLVGFLAAGFVLNAIGFEKQPQLDTLANLGVTLLLFAIGLKLDVRSLGRPAIWGGSLIHATVSTLLVAAVVWLMAFSPWALVAGLSPMVCVLIGFALCFSSTVFAVKVQETAGDAAGLHARTAIGFLIMQDIMAVVFLAAAKGQVPSPWAVLVIPALFIIRPITGYLLRGAGHGELLILLGWMIAAAGYLGFEKVGLKGDLGALVIGAVVAGHPRSNEMAKSLLSFKDFFLVGFFLTIGLQATPTWGALGLALLLIGLLPLKVVGYFWILTLFKYRSRTAILAALGLASYSEFGLIIAAIAMNKGWIGSEWLTVIAMAVAISFVIGAPLSTRGLKIYAAWENFLRRYEKPDRLPEERPVPISEHRAVVFGMGGVGAACYDQLRETFGEDVIGVDVHRPVVVAHRAEGRQCVVGDASDQDFWDRCHVGSTELIMLCLPNTGHAIRAAGQLRERGFCGHLGAIALYDDDVERLREAGCDMAFAMYREAGVGLADSVIHAMESDVTRVHQQSPVTSVSPADEPDGPTPGDSGRQ